MPKMESITARDVNDIFTLLPADIIWRLHLENSEWTWTKPTHTNPGNHIKDVSPPKVAIKSLLLSCLKDVAKILRSGYSQNN